VDATLLDSLRRHVGDDAVFVDAETLRSRRHDYWVVSHLRAWRDEPIARPGCVVRPRSTSDVSTVMRWASEHRVAVVPFGLGSGVVGGILPTPDMVLLDLSSMAATVSIDTTDLLATFQAGRNGLSAEEEVATHGLTIGHWPQSVGVSSVGGWVSTRASGQFSTAYGNIDDVVHSFEVVLSSGDVVRLGRAPRAASGPDLRHLVMGAEGTMGVITEVTFSLRRQPPSRTFTAFHATSMADGIEAQRRIVHADWRPPVMRLYDHVEVRRSFKGHVDGTAALLLMVHEGPPGRVAAEVDDVTRIALEAGLRVAAPGATEQWMERRNHVPSWTQLFEAGVVVDTIEVSAPWTTIGAIYDDAVASLGELDGVTGSAHSSHVYRSGINLYFTFVARCDPAVMESTYHECWRRVMEATVRHGGGISHHHGIGRQRRPWLVHDLGTAGVELLRTVQHAVDPAGIMNPGVLLPDP
jgi:alkyldihydroxyacetonephosphate synthase